MTTAPDPQQRRDARRAMWRRLGRQVLLGAAGAVGSGLVGLIPWWLTAR
jgi:hypothetical protein